MWPFEGTTGLILIIIIGIILSVIYFRFDIKPRHSAWEATGIILLIVGGGIAAIIVIWALVQFAFWINSNLGLAVFILIIFYILWAIAAYAVKHKKELLLHILGAYIVSKIEAFVAGMSIIIHTPVGVITLSLGSLTWVGLFDPRFGQQWTFTLPAYVWVVASATLCWGIATLLGGMHTLIKSSFHSKAETNTPVSNTPSMTDDQ